MTIERVIFSKKPILGLALESPRTHQRSFRMLMARDLPREELIHITCREGDYDMLPPHMKDKGFRAELKVLESGVAAYVLRATDPTAFHRIGDEYGIDLKSGGVTINIPDDTRLLPIAFQSEDRKIMELYELVRYTPGNNPSKQKIRFL